MELIDWSERYPNESARQIAVRQSTLCPCGREKEIGYATCGHEQFVLSAAQRIQVECFAANFVEGSDDLFALGAALVDSIERRRLFAVRRKRRELEERR